MEEPMDKLEELPLLKDRGWLYDHSIGLFQCATCGAFADEIGGAPDPHGKHCEGCEYLTSIEGKEELRN